MIEMWKDIEGYECRYQVSDHGRVRSLDRTITDKNGMLKSVKGKMLSPCDNGNGYMYVSLGKGNHKYIHHLVARAFVFNERDLKEVNHINENKRDNKAINLEWVTHLENIRHGTGIERGAKARTPKLLNGKASRPVRGHRLSDGEVIQFPSISEAKRNGFDSGRVISCCKGKISQYRGYRFEYAN